MAEHPTLLQRPIGIYESGATVGWPMDKPPELVAAWSGGG